MPFGMMRLRCGRGNTMDGRATPPAQASARQTELGDIFDRTLFSALDALEERKIPYCIIGGIAASGLGRPRSTHDIDLFVRPEDAEAALEALGKHGFDTDRTDVRWLFKGWKEQMMVDIIFKSEGDIYFDDGSCGFVSVVAKYSCNYTERN